MVDLSEDEEVDDTAARHANGKATVKFAKTDNDVADGGEDDEEDDEEGGLDDDEEEEDNSADAEEAELDDTKSLDGVSNPPMNRRADPQTVADGPDGSEDEAEEEDDGEDDDEDEDGSEELPSDLSDADDEPNEFAGLDDFVQKLVSEDAEKKRKSAGLDGVDGKSKKRRVLPAVTGTTAPSTFPLLK